MIYVLDSTFIGAQIIPNKKYPEVYRKFAKIKQDDEKHTPHLIWYEMADIFKNLMSRNHYSHDKILNFFPLLDAMDLNCDHASGTEYSKKILSLCNTYNLSSYDSAYLELAERKKAVLCTTNDKLRAAAKKHGVAVIK